MNARPITRTGGEILVHCLKRHGADILFGVPGESYLSVLDALHDASELRLITCRQEGGAAMMAEAYGKLTGRPGLCFVTRGPGASNASAGVHVASQDSTPMILFIGQVPRPLLEREAFQEIDYRRMFGSLAKWVAQVEDPRRMPEYVNRAFHTAVAGRPGPVVLALPEDVLSARAALSNIAPYQTVQPHPAPHQLVALREMLGRSQRPLLILGEGGWDGMAREGIRAFSERHRVPVSVSFRCQDLFDNRHPHYVGDVGIGINPRLAQRVREADLLLAVGGRLGDITTGGYTLVQAPRPQQRLVRVHPDPQELGRVYGADLPINAGVGAFAAAVAELAPVASCGWRAWLEAARGDYLAWIVPTRIPGELQLAEIVAWLRERLPEDAIVTNGAGNYTAWVHRFYQYRRYRTQLAPISGSMGYGLPAAVAAKLVCPEQTVICFAGDGCFQMTLQEFATAVQYGVNIIVIVVNNTSWGTIRMHQERRFPGRVMGTDLVNPDFAAFARACGGHAEGVRCTEAFPAAFEAALASGKPALLELRLDVEALTPGASLSEIRALGKKAMQNHRARSR